MLFAICKQSRNEMQCVLSEQSSQAHPISKPMHLKADWHSPTKAPTRQRYSRPSALGPHNLSQPKMANTFLLVGSLASIVFFLVVAKVAAVTGAGLLPFPELGALGFDIFTRPTGAWAQAPLLVIATPTAAAVVGTLVTKTMAYGIASITLCIAGAMIIIRLLRSPVTPALSAALLPLSLSIASWWYPAAIFATTGCLTLLSTAYNRRWASQIRSMQPSVTDAQDDEMERPPRQYAWLPVFVGFLLVTYGISRITGLRLVLFPPLVAIAFEMFAHAEVCPWAKRPFALPAACTITAAAGVESIIIFGTGTASIATAMLAGIVTLRMFRVHLPPALAICLLPQMITDVDWQFVYGIAIGTVTLTGVFLLARSRLWIAAPV
jgi:hypothetical protein